MAAEEFQESDVIFPDHIYANGLIDFREMFIASQANSRLLVSHNNSKKKKRCKSSSVHQIIVSAPVKIPEAVLLCTAADSDDFEEVFGGEDDGELVPPHVIIGRRLAGKTAFSVCTGNGRTLKGRDLSEVRNSILRKTGFLET